MTVSDCQESAKSDLFGSDIEFGACDFGKRDYNTFLAKGEPPMKKQNQNMIQGPLFSNIILYTIPIILTSVLQLFFNAADLVIVGRFCGSISVAAVGATGSITALMVNLFIGLSVGVGVTVAHAIGGREDEAVHRTVHTAIPSALICGVFVTVIGVCFCGTFLRMMGTPENVLPLSTVYMRIYFAGITFTMVYNFCASILRAAGDTKSPLIFLSIAGVVNVVLNVIFVTQFHMNVAGVALATTISQGISAVLVVITLMRRTDSCKLVLRKMRIYAPQLTKIVRIGLPAGVQSSLFAISNVLIQSSVNSFGDIFMSGNAAAGNIEGFVYVGMNAFYQAAISFMGQNVGAGKYKRVNKILISAEACVIAIGLAMSMLVLLFDEPLLGLYTDSPVVVEAGKVRLSVICTTYFLCGMMDVMVGALRGLGYSIAPMIVSLLGACAFRLLWIATVFQIDRFHTIETVYTSYPISWTLTFFAHVVTFIIVRHRLKKRWGE